jgi:UDP-N-acetylglucosamine--N-acetylmuramyl-(pentapeptide) pyrophosphoryl-undecaprenol N-acetylglucosamine transferase
MFFCYAADTKGIQVIHFTGEGERVAAVQQRYRDAGIHATVRSYENEMDYAWAIADLVISRAGAGTIAEQIEYEVPGILVPFPFATDNHQEKNADFMVDTVGGAIKMRESDAAPSQMAKLLAELLADNRRQLNGMKDAIQNYKRQAQVPNLSTVVQEALL